MPDSTRTRIQGRIRMDNADGDLGDPIITPLTSDGYYGPEGYIEDEPLYF